MRFLSGVITSLAVFVLLFFLSASTEEQFVADLPYVWTHDATHGRSPRHLDVGLGSCFPFACHDSFFCLVRDACLVASSKEPGNPNELLGCHPGCHAVLEWKWWRDVHGLVSATNPGHRV